jgi:hypothetical protein
MFHMIPRSNEGMHFVQKVSTTQSSFVKAILQINKAKGI